MQCDTEQLYDCLVSVALDLADAEEGYLFIRDPTTDFLHLKKASNAMETEGVIRRPIDTGILGLIATQKCKHEYSQSACCDAFALSGVYSCSDMMTSKFYEPSTDRFSVRGSTTALTSVLCFPIFAKSRGQLFCPEQVVDGEECVATPVRKEEDAEMVAVLYLNNKRARFGSHFLGMLPCLACSVGNKCSPDVSQWMVHDT